MSTLQTLPLPALAGTRRRAQSLLSNLPTDLSSATVVIDCRGLVAATESFADEMISELLVERRAQLLKFVNVSDLAFAKWVDDRALFHGVQSKVAVDRRV